MSIEKDLRILLVEDEPNVASTLVRALQREFGSSIYSCVSAEDAILLLDSETFDLLIADFNLPGMSGLELIIQARTSNSKLRIIFMTASPTAQSERAQQYSDLCMTKPFRIPDLLVRIRDLTQKK